MATPPKNARKSRAKKPSTINKDLTDETSTTAKRTTRSMNKPSKEEK